MAASAKVLTLEKPKPTGDWTIVLPRRGRQRRNFSITKSLEHQQPWVPPELVSDPDREAKLMQKMLSYMKRVESSSFYHTFINQIQTTQILDRIFRVMGSQPKMQMVIYGIGSIESYEPPRLQLCLAILMKRKFTWIGEIEVFDPIISATESRVLKALGCSVLSVNEQGRRRALKPMMFYMPHCEAELYDNLLQANWRADLLNHIVLFGNSFEAYEQHVSIIKNSTVVDRRKHILALRRFAEEFEIDTPSDDYFRAFHDLSWHFFSLDPQLEMQSIKL